MNKMQVITMVTLSAAVFVLLVLYWIEAQAVRGLKSALRSIARAEKRPEVSEVRAHIDVVAALNRRINELQRETSLLRAEVREGCGIINQQKEMITKLRHVESRAKTGKLRK